MLTAINSEAADVLAEKVARLSDPAAHPGCVGGVTRRETHMSWLFFADETVYKLKKPVRLAYLDFSTLARREAACRQEFRLNQRLAPGVYLGVAPLVRRDGALAIGGGGQVVDWLVVMRRLDQSLTLEARVLAGRAGDVELDQLARLLSRFYRRAARTHPEEAAHLAGWRAAVEANRAVLLHPTSGLPRGRVRAVLATQRRFLRRRGGLLAERARQDRIVDAHGDLRPEHVWIGPPVRIIDRLEFNATLRRVDPLDEIAFLDLELEALGAPAAGRRIRGRVLTALNERPAPELYLFYRSHRAMLRARLSIAHLLEPKPRTPEKWPPQARRYLALAAHDARRIEVLIRTPAGR